MSDSDALQDWLKANDLSELLPILVSAEYDDLSDLQDLEDEDDIDMVVEELNIDSNLQTKFKAALLSLIAINTNSPPNEAPPSQQNRSHTEHKMDPETKDDNVSDDDCCQEVYIDPSNKHRLQPIWNSDTAESDFVKCIGSLRIEFADKTKLTEPEFCHGSGTVIHIDEKDCCHVLTAAHNGYQLLRKCPGCNKKTITRICSNCDRYCTRVQPLQLIQATSITFHRRCIVKKHIDPTGVERYFGDTMSSYHVDNYFINHPLYKQNATAKSGCDICVMIFQCDNVEDAEMYRRICSSIKLVSDPTFGSEFKTRLHIFGYPGGKGYVDKDSGQMMHQMYGMSTGIHSSNMKVETHSITKKTYIINDDIDTEPGMSGSAIWTIYEKTQFKIYAVHTGGKQKEDSGENYGTFLDDDHINWIHRIQNHLLLKPGFNIVPFKQREYTVPKSKTEMVSIKTTVGDLNDDEKKMDVRSETREPEMLVAGKNHKIILVCGKTGTGKTTLINSMMNYIYGISKDDKYRVKLIDEAEKNRSDTKSQTDHISSYTIKKPKGGNIDYDLTIIDTPGFGDCRGIEKDKETVAEFKYIFNKILANISGICFIVKADDTRLTPMQIYVFNNMLNLWGNDVADNIFILMTFADAGEPICIKTLNDNEVLKECQHRFKMNNSAFKHNPLEEYNAFYETFWEMGMKCFEDFFHTLDKIEPKPLAKSIQVLIKREEIQQKIRLVREELENVFIVQKNISEIEKKIHEVKKQLDEAFIKQSNIFENQNRAESQKKPKVNKVNKPITWIEEKIYYSGQKIEKWNLDFVFSCTAHKRTCHQCYNNKGLIQILKRMVIGKWSCIMVNEKDECKVCGCNYSKHISNIEYVRKTKRIQRSIVVTDCKEKEVVCDEEKQNEYIEQEQALSAVENVIKQLKEREQTLLSDITEKKDLVACITEKVAFIRKLQIELEKIALRPHMTTVGAYIDTLIENEKKKKYMNENKIQMLEDLKKQESAIIRLEKNTDVSTIVFKQ